MNMLEILKNLAFLYKFYILAVLSMGYMCGELGHFLLGVTSKAMAQDLHYGDITCQLNNTEVYLNELPVLCSTSNNSETCLSYTLNNTPYCEWTYNGLGMDYQILAGPSFIAVLTVGGILMGYLADHFNRVKIMAMCTLIFGLAITLCGTVNAFWQLVVLRMVMAAGLSGCGPLSTGILSDIFPENKRALAISVFSWGVYGGSGIAFPVGRYIPSMNFWGLGWRITYYGTGIVAIILAVLAWFTLKEPERTSIGEEAAYHADAKSGSIWRVFTDPKIILLVIGGSIRYSGGMAFAYDYNLYFEQYFPDFDAGWWLFADVIIVGSIGLVMGATVSDKIVTKMGIRSRCAVLAISQLISTPFAFGSVYFSPTWAMVTLAFSMFFAPIWLGILLAMVVEIVPLSVRSVSVGIFIFVLNNIGGNLPIVVDPVSKAIGFRESLYIFYAGFYGISSILFLITTFFMGGPKPNVSVQEKNPAEFKNSVSTIYDEIDLPTVTHF